MSIMKQDTGTQLVTQVPYYSPKPLWPNCCVAKALLWPSDAVAIQVISRLPAALVALTLEHWQPSQSQRT